MFTISLRDGNVIVQRSSEKMIEDAKKPVTKEASKEDTPEIKLVRWAVDNDLISSDAGNLAMFLIKAGWTTIDQVRQDFSEHDIPADFPKRYRTRLINAVRRLRNGDNGDNGDRDNKDEDETKPRTTEVHIHYHKRYHELRWKDLVTCLSSKRYYPVISQGNISLNVTWGLVATGTNVLPWSYHERPK